MFDSPDAISALARDESIDLSGTTLFYYEAYEFQCIRPGDWVQWGPEESFPTQVVRPRSAYLEGFDVVTFFAGSSAECSPLSCNALAKEIDTNQHCLLGSFEEARQLLDEGRFENSEPGPYRIFAIHTLRTEN